MESNVKTWTYFIILGLFLSTAESEAQAQERISPPTKPSKVKSIDDFSNYCFEIYDTVFVYDSLVQAGVEIPAEMEDKLAEYIETRIDSLADVVPDMIDEVERAPFMRKVRAARNLNKSRKAITYMLQFAKRYTFGEAEDLEVTNVEN